MQEPCHDIIQKKPAVTGRDSDHILEFLYAEKQVESVYTKKMSKK